MSSPARRVALDIVTRVRERSAYAHQAADTILASAGLEPRDAAFVRRIAYGTIAARGTLDEAVARHLSDPAHLEARVSDALAISAYELLFASTPARAAVNEGVELVRSVQPRAAGLANAVLRKVAADVASFPWGDPKVSDAALARLYGFPTWIATMWSNERGHENAESMLAASNEPAPLFLANASPTRGDDELAAELQSEGISTESCGIPGCFITDDSAAAIRSSALKGGGALVVDAGAQLATRLVPVADGGTVVELGAGRGSKSVLLASQAARNGIKVEVLAVDLHAFKLDALKAAATRAAVEGISTLAADATNHESEGMPAAGTVDSVLVDAPCSGLGTLRRHPDRRWRARPEELSALAALGGKLLRTAAHLVKPGGFVVYSTCTVAHAENEQVIAAFLGTEAGVGFEIDPLSEQVPEQWSRFVTREGFFQSLPEQGGMDGHFVARLKRVM